MPSRIKIRHDNLNVEGILLAKYNQKVDRLELVTKRILFIKYRTYKFKKVNEEIYLVFIPWKHRLKEIVMVSGNNIIDSQNICYPKEWVSVEKYVSKAYDGKYALNKDQIEINKFFGYSWIHENNSFLADIFLSNDLEFVTTLYKNMNYLVKEEFDEGEY